MIKICEENSLDAELFFIITYNLQSRVLEIQFFFFKYNFKNGFIYNLKKPKKVPINIETNARRRLVS